MSEARVYTLAHLPRDTPMPLAERARVIGEKMMISDVLLAPGFELATHHHENEQFMVVLSGRCTFGIGAEGSPERHEVEVRAGQVLHVPSNTPHSCRALEETRILDLFSPPSATTGIDAGR